VLLRSLKPSLHANVDCTALFAAIVSRQVAVVRHLLQVRIICEQLPQKYTHVQEWTLDS
jgi:hypothetical protein